MKPTSVRTKHWIQYNSLLFLEHFLGYSLYTRLFEKSRNRINTAIREDLGPPEPGHEVCRIRPGDGWRTTRKLLAGPVIFEGAARDWPCVRRWSISFFQEQFGDEDIILNDLVGIVDPENPQSFQRMKLREYFELLKNGSLKYLKFSNIIDRHPELQDDLDHRWLDAFNKPFSFGKKHYLFIGGKGTKTPLHNEFPSVLYVQVKGRKKWIMYPPGDRIFFDPRAERKTYFYSEANPEKPDDQRYPLFRYAKKYEFVMDEGDVLWFPPFHWHHVENLSESIGVAYKFANIGAGYRSSSLLTFLFLMSTRPNLVTKFIMSRVRNDDYTLTKSNSSYD